MAMRRITVRLRADQHAWLKAESKRTGRSMSAIVRAIIDRYLANEPGG
jgi:predicted DNA-binding protein